MAKLYNPNELSISLGPVLIGSGFADGEFLRIEMETEMAQDVVGTDGEVTISRTNDNRATVTFMLMQTADANDGLSAIANAFKNIPGAVGGIHPLRIRDQNGRSLYVAQNAWIEKEPDVSFDRTATTREWPVKCANLVRFDGGNSTP